MSGHDDTSLQDIIEDKSIISPSRTAEGIKRRETIVHWLENLRENERRVITLRFGLDGGEPQTLEEFRRANYSEELKKNGKYFLIIQKSMDIISV